MVRMNPETPRHFFIEDPKIPRIPDDPEGPGGPTGPNNPPNPGGPSGPTPREPLLPFEDRDLPPILGRPYQDIVNDYNKVIGNINRYNKQLYDHETAYNKGDYSFASGNKSTAESVIANDKDKLDKLEQQRKNLELELKFAEKKDSVGAAKYKDKLATYESYDDYKARMDKVSGAENPGSTGGTDNAGVINTDKKEYRLPSNQQELKELLVGMGLATFNEDKQTITFGYHVEADGKFHNGGFSNYSMDKFYEYYTNNKDQFNMCLDSYASGAGWTKTDKVSGAENPGSTGGTDDAGVINTDKKEYRLPADKKEFIDLLVGLGLAQYFPSKNGKSDTLNMLYQLKNGELVKSGNANSSDYWFNQYGNNSEFMSALDKFAQGAGWTKTDKVSGAENPGSTGGADETDPVSQQLDAELQALQNELDALNGELNTLNGELNTLNGELNTLNNDKTTLEGNKATLEQEIKDLKAELNKANAELRDTQANINAIDRHNPIFQILLNNRDQIESKIKELTNSIASKTSELSSINSQISAIDAAIETKKGEIETKNGEIKTLNGEINDKKGEIDTKQGEIANRQTYLDNNKDGSTMRFDTDYGIKNTSTETTDGSLQTYLKQIRDNGGVPNDNQKQQLINLLTKYGVSNAEAYINKLLEGDGKITDAEIRNLLASLKDRINGNGKGNSYDTMIKYIFPTNNNNNTNKSDTKALEEAIKKMGLRETNCKGVYCEQHNPSMPKGNYTHQRHYVWDPQNQKMVELPGVYYISSDGHEVKNNDLLKKWKDGTFKGYGLVHTAMDGKTTSRYTA